MDVSTKIAGISTAKIEFIHEVRNQNNQVITTAKTIMVCVDGNIKPKAIPEALRESLAFAPEEVKPG